MLERKRTIIKPVASSGRIGPEILVEKSIWEQIVEIFWQFVFGGLALYGALELLIKAWNWAFG
jgi:hypothetical protein